MVRRRSKRLKHFTYQRTVAVSTFESVNEYLALVAAGIFLGVIIEPLLRWNQQRRRNGSREQATKE